MPARKVKVWQGWCTSPWTQTTTDRTFPPKFSLFPITYTHSFSHQLWPFFLSSKLARFYKIGFYYIVTWLAKETLSKFIPAFVFRGIGTTNFNSKSQNFTVTQLLNMLNMLNTPENSYWVWQGANSNIRVGISIKVHISSNWISKKAWITFKNLKRTGHQNGHWATKMSLLPILWKRHHFLLNWSLRAHL